MSTPELRCCRNVVIAGVDDWMYMLNSCSDVAIIAPARQLGVRAVVAAPGDGNSKCDIEQPNAWAGTTVCLTHMTTSAWRCNFEGTPQRLIPYWLKHPLSSLRGPALVLQDRGQPPHCQIFMQ